MTITVLTKVKASPKNRISQLLNLTTPNQSFTATCRLKRSKNHEGSKRETKIKCKLKKVTKCKNCWKTSVCCMRVKSHDSGQTKRAKSGVRALRVFLTLIIKVRRCRFVNFRLILVDDSNNCWKKESRMFTRMNKRLFGGSGSEIEGLWPWIFIYFISRFLIIFSLCHSSN